MIETISEREIMEEKILKYVYGPVYSWRLGMSLGIDPLSDKHKICNLDCIYCQLGRTANLTNERKVYVPTHEIINEINSLPNLELDYITICGRGEPTLAKNLGDIIRSIKDVRKEKIAVITNSSLLDLAEVRNDLAIADCIVAKLDAFDQDSFNLIDKSIEDVEFSHVLAGLKEFRKTYKGKMALQIMFIKENQYYAKELAEVIKDIGANEIELNTPLRPCACQSLNEEELAEIKRQFIGLPVITVYEKDKKDYKPLNERDTIQRHGNYKSAVNS